MQQRRLAAIMFTDIVGYTSLMGKNEDRAFELLRKNQEIHRKLLGQFKGTLIKEMGDGMLISFDLPSDAVRCALELQKASKKEGIPLKIGIHEGEMVFDGSDVLGDGVNIASRLQENAKGGTIQISENVYQTVKNKAGFQIKSLGSKKFKNVDNAYRVYEISPASPAEATTVKLDKSTPRRWLYLFFTLATIIIIILAIWLFRLSSASSSIMGKEKSIAVMPFDYESTNEDSKYFVNGMMEDIRNNLSKIGDLKVISKTTSEKYRDSDLSIPEIAEELGVSYVLEGTVTILRDKVRIHAQLIDGETDDHIWADNYDRNLTDVFGVQTEISMNIARELYASISTEEERIIGHIPTMNLEALNFYNRGRFYHEAYWIEGTSTMGLGILSIHSEDTVNLDRAIAQYRLALNTDPSFAEAYSALALALAQKYSGTPYFEGNIQDTMLYLADKAISINDQLEEAYLLKAIYYRQVGSRMDLAINNLEKALKINPNYASAYLEMGSIYIWEVVDCSKGLRYLYNAYDLDKSYLLPTTLDGLSTGYQNTGLFQEAESYRKELLKLTNNNKLYLNTLAFMEWCKGDVHSSINQALKVLELDSLDYEAIRFLTFRYSYAGDMKNSFHYFKKYLELVDSTELRSRNFAHRVGYILYMQGREEQAKTYFNLEIEHCWNDIKEGRLSATRGYVYYDLFAMYAFLQEYDQAFEALQQLQENWDFYPSWLMTYFKLDPLHEGVREDPRFRDFLIQAEGKFKREHDRVMEWLETKNTIPEIE